ncbi:hypothetical protein M1P56_17355 [Streptomyces sp. HU2014]|uniref:Uncharacterized protein n=1 Tax=Streptomyces albireticuli TaxID=1940 RepID=A0A1Z2KUE4_9ACTN|nr:MULTISPECIES: hypothetical protein [Streptomyces]ARZ65674.1 hypothetical protein SMD11_0005 [Streptomyces albireticuli]UQI45991.1 hypothetical protein M1P56_17355 [Streptomyces sp. HU2014]
MNDRERLAQILPMVAAELSQAPAEEYQVVVYPEPEARGFEDRLIAEVGPGDRGEDVMTLMVLIDT